MCTGVMIFYIFYRLAVPCVVISKKIEKTSTISRREKCLFYGCPKKYVDRHAYRCRIVFESIDWCFFLLKNVIKL